MKIEEIFSNEYCYFNFTNIMCANCKNKCNNCTNLEINRYYVRDKYDIPTVSYKCKNYFRKS